MKAQRTPLRVAFRRPWPGTVRGRVLWLCSIILASKGLAWLLGNPTEAADSAVRLLTQWAPLHFWGIVVVALCVWSAFCSYCHYGRDRWGFDTLTGLSGALAAAYFFSPLIEGVPPYASIQGGLSWGVIGVLLIYLRRLRDVRDEQLRGDR